MTFLYSQFILQFYIYTQDFHLSGLYEWQGPLETCFAYQLIDIHYHFFLHTDNQPTLTLVSLRMLSISRTGHFFIQQRLFLFWSPYFKSGLPRMFLLSVLSRTCLLYLLFHTTCVMDIGVVYGFGHLGALHPFHTGYILLVLQ